MKLWHFLKSVPRPHCKPGETRLLIGFDLIKDADVLHARLQWTLRGVNRQHFNKNMLVPHSIRETWRPALIWTAFEHVAFWNRRKIAALRCIWKACTKQTVWVEDLGRGFHFEQGERHPYREQLQVQSHPRLRCCCAAAAFKLEKKNWTDPKGWFCEALARVVKARGEAESFPGRTG